MVSGIIQHGLQRFADVFLFVMDGMQCPVERVGPWDVVPHIRDIAQRVAVSTFAMTP